MGVSTVFILGRRLLLALALLRWHRAGLAAVLALLLLARHPDNLRTALADHYATAFLPCHVLPPRSC